MKLFLVSNMYPSEKYPNFGVFVKNFELAFIENGGTISKKVVINSLYNSFLKKCFAYFVYYCKLLYKGLIADYDMIYVHYVSHNALPVFLISRIRNKKIVLNFHGDDLIPRSLLTHFLHIFVKLTLKKTDLVVLPSDYFKSVFINKFEFSHNKLYVSPSGGINSDYFYQSSKVFDKSNITLGFVSRIDKGKGWRNFIRLIDDLNNIGNLNVLGVIVGDGAERKQMVDELLKEETKNNIKLYESLNHFDLAKVYRTFDLFIFPSELPESLGLVGIEAMASGVPCIGSSAGGIASYLKENYNGYAFDTNDYDQLFFKTSKYLNLSADMKMEMKINCLETAKRYEKRSVGKLLYFKLMDI
jgi:glycosyltransferase involved in cell wall biosynthesis